MKPIPWAKPNFSQNEQKHLMNALESSWISGGWYVDEFEKRFAELNSAKYCVSVSNGTTALHLALLAGSVGPGDEVIVPNFTFVAPGNMALAVGAIPVFVDIDPDTWCIDPEEVRKAITSKTKAVLPVHVYGNVAAMKELQAICREYGLLLIEDTAEAAFSKLSGKSAGTFGDFGTFSFHATKTITMGEGGAVLTDNPAHHEKMRLIRDHGMNKKKRYWHEVPGFNFRVTNLQAAIGYGQLESLSANLAGRQEKYLQYRERLMAIPGVKLQKFEKGVEPAIWALGIELDPARFPQGRDAVMASMTGSGIETRPGFYPFMSMPIYPKRHAAPASERVAAQMIALPFYPQLESEEIRVVCDTLKNLAK